MMIFHIDLTSDDNEQNPSKTFRLLPNICAIGREVGSHNGWSYDQSRDRPTSPLLYLQIIIKKGYVVFVILWVN